MTVVRTNRSRFDEAIDDDLNTVLILSGAYGSAAQAVHDAAASLLHQYRKVFILRDVSVLSADEQDLWLGGLDKWAMYSSGRSETTGWGNIGDLLDGNGLPDLLKIREQYALAEVAG